MLHLEKVNGKNVWDILKLTVSESQKSFVAGNEVSMIEAYIRFYHRYGFESDGCRKQWNPGTPVSIVRMIKKREQGIWSR